MCIKETVIKAVTVGKHRIRGDNFIKAGNMHVWEPGLEVATERVTDDHAGHLGGTTESIFDNSKWVSTQVWLQLRRIDFLMSDTVPFRGCIGMKIHVITRDAV